jgi:hypothetical protein
VRQFKSAFQSIVATNLHDESAAMGPHLRSRPYFEMGAQPSSFEAGWTSRIGKNAPSPPGSRT